MSTIQTARDLVPFTRTQQKAAIVILLVVKDGNSLTKSYLNHRSKKMDWDNSLKRLEKEGVIVAEKENKQKGVTGARSYNVYSFVPEVFTILEKIYETKGGHEAFQNLAREIYLKRPMKDLPNALEKIFEQSQRG